MIAGMYDPEFGEVIEDEGTTRVLKVFQDKQIRKQIIQRKKEIKQQNDQKMDQILKYVNFGDLKKNKEFKDCLKFPSCYHVMNEEIKKEKDLENSKKVIAQLYEKLVPEYLLEDHPVEIPDVARELIKQQTNVKGTGKTGDQMDTEFSILYRENEAKRRKKTSKDSHGSGQKNKLYKNLYKFQEADHATSENFKVHQMTPEQEEMMKSYVDRKFTERHAQKLVKQVK